MDHTSGYQLPAWVGASPSLAFDIETDASTDVISGQVTALSLSDGTHAHFIDTRLNPDKTRDLLAALFKNKEIIGHNLSFDIMFVKQQYGVDYPERVYDTQLAEQSLTAGLNDLEVGLDDVAERRCGVVLDKSLRLSFGNPQPFTSDQEAYSVSDVKLLHAIKSQQVVEIEREGLDRILSLETFALPVFAEMQRAGVAIDPEKHRELIENYTMRRDALKDQLQLILTPYIRDEQIRKRDLMQDKLDAWQAAYDAQVLIEQQRWQDELDYQTNIDQHSSLEWDMNKWNDLKINKKDGKPEGMRRFVRAQMQQWRAKNPRPLKPVLDRSLINLNSQPQMIVAFKNMGIEFPDFSANSIATILSNTEDEETRALLTSLLSYKKLEKMIQSFGESLAQRIAADGRLHGNFRQIGTGTGRPSCSKPNLLQMPKRGENKIFRRIFIPADGNLFVKADYSQMEMRIMAQMSGDRNMQEAFRKNLDLHTYTASLMFKVPFDQVTDNQRTTAKTINFGILYGMGPNKLRATLAADGIRMSRDEARKAIDLWKRTYPQATKTIQTWGLKALAKGWTATAWGRKRYFDIENIEDDQQRFAIQREGANHPIQGGNADITKLAMVLIHRYLEGKGVIVLSVYDEIVVEVPRAYATWARDVVEKCMNLAAEQLLTDVPSAVDAKISTSWSDLDELPSA